MKLTAYTIQDNKINAYGAPMHVKTLAEMTESIVQSFENMTGNQAVKINPIEHDLFELGTYDTDTAKYTLHSAPKHIINVRAILNQAIDATSTKSETKKAIKITQPIESK